MGSCSGIKDDGGRCRGQAIRGSEWCFSHHPDYEEQRRRRASKGGKRGGRGRPGADLTDLKRQLQELTDGVLSGEVERGVAAVCAQLLNVKLRAVEVERKIRETEELEARLEALERAAEEQRGGNRWGA